MSSKKKTKKTNNKSNKWVWSLLMHNLYYANKSVLLFAGFLGTHIEYMCT